MFVLTMAAKNMRRASFINQIKQNSENKFQRQIENEMALLTGNTLSWNVNDVSDEIAYFHCKMLALVVQSTLLIDIKTKIE